MYSIAFPDMFSNSYTKLVKDHEATKSNLKLLLSSDKGSLFGDPDYGTVIMKYLFEQNDNVVKSLLVEKIYMAIKQFMPQLIVERKNIQVTAPTMKSIQINITAINKIDYQLDTYSIELVENSEE